MEFYIQDQTIFEKLSSQKDTFNNLCSGLEIDWQPLLDKKASRIITHLKCDLENDSNFEIYYEWLITNGEVFVNAINEIL